MSQKGKISTRSPSKPSKSPAARRSIVAATAAVESTTPRAGEAAVRGPEVTLKLVKSDVRVSPAERHNLIAKRAYLFSRSNVGRAGTPFEDWLRAEREVDTALADGTLG